MIAMDRHEIALSYATGALVGELAHGIEVNRAREAAEHVVVAYLRIALRIAVDDCDQCDFGDLVCRNVTSETTELNNYETAQALIDSGSDPR